MVALNFQPIFEYDIAEGRKRSTIRKTMRCKIGDKLQFYVAQRTKDCRKIGEGICIGIADISVNLPDGTPWAVNGKIGEVFVCKRLANQEGFLNQKDFCDFFKYKYGYKPFRGYMHVWELTNPQNKSEANAVINQLAEALRFYGNPDVYQEAREALTAAEPYLKPTI